MPRILFYFSLFLALIALGALGFMILDSLGPEDAFARAISAVTFADYALFGPNPLQALFVVSLSFFGYYLVFSMISSSIMDTVEKGVGKMLKHRLRKEKIKKLENHAIVCGYGRVGRAVVEELVKKGIPTVVIERDERAVEHITDPLVYPIVADVIHRDEALDEAGIQRAKYFFAALGEDADNIFVILSVRERNPKVKVIARANTEDGYRHLRRAGADIVIMPASVGGKKMVEEAEKS